LTEENYIPMIQSEFEGNYMQTRPRATRVRKRWNLSWGVLPEAEFQTLQLFVNTATGNMFGWTHPVTTSVHTCTILGYLNSGVISPGFRSAKIGIGEI